MPPFNKTSRRARRKIPAPPAPPGPGAFTLCMIAGAEGKSPAQARPLATLTICVTRILLRGTPLKLTVTDPKLTPAELRAAMRMTRELLKLLHAANARAPAAPPPRFLNLKS